MKKQKTKFIFYLLLVIIWMLVIFMFSNMDSSSSNNGSKGIIKEVINKVTYIFNIDIDEEDVGLLVNKLNYPLRKVMHFSVYFILSLLVLNLFKTKNNWYKYLIVIIICLFYAISDECHQLLVSGRTGQVLDIFIDTMGACLGVLIYYLINRKKLNNKVIVINSRFI